MTPYEQAQAKVQGYYPGSLVKPIGSAHICGLGADMDFVVLVRDLITGRDQGRDHAIEWAGDNVERSMMSGEEDGWCSGRVGDINVILTDSPLFFLGQALTAEIAKQVYERVGTLFAEKDDRIQVHRIADNMIAEIERRGS